MSNVALGFRAARRKQLSSAAARQVDAFRCNRSALFVQSHDIRQAKCRISDQYPNQQVVAVVLSLHSCVEISLAALYLAETLLCIIPLMHVLPCLKFDKGVFLLILTKADFEGG